MDMTKVTNRTNHTARDLAGPGGVTACFVEVTPDHATLWLHLNERNRNVNPRVVDRYLRDMDAGNWAFNGETIKFAANGKLLDGQHRLTAIVRHGRPILALVVRGLPDASQDVMDTGRKRTGADMFAINQRRHAVTLAAVTRLAVAWQQGKITTADSKVSEYVSNPMLRDAVNDDPMLEWATALATSLNAEFPAKSSAVGFSAWLMGYTDQDATIDFLTAVAEMRTDGTGDPRFTLRRRLNQAKENRERLTAIEESYMIVRSWNAWRNGERLSMLKTNSPAGGPMAFPQA